MLDRLLLLTGSIVLALLLAAGAQRGIDPRLLDPLRAVSAVLEGAAER